MLRAGAALTAPCTDHGGRRTAFFAATPIAVECNAHLTPHTNTYTDRDTHTSALTHRTHRKTIDADAQTAKHKPQLSALWVACALCMGYVLCISAGLFL